MFPSDKTFQREIAHFKSDHPAAEGGYGLTFLEATDTTTLPTFQATMQRLFPNEKIKHLTLEEERPIIKMRPLIEQIIERKLKRGELSEMLIAFSTIHRDLFSMIIIDNAHLLHQEALLWICSTLRSIQNENLFLLLVRDEAMFIKTVEKYRYPDWLWGRSIPVWLTTATELKPTE